MFGYQTGVWKYFIIDHGRSHPIQFHVVPNAEVLTNKGDAYSISMSRLALYTSAKKIARVSEAINV